MFLCQNLVTVIPFTQIRFNNGTVFNEVSKFGPTVWRDVGDIDKVTVVVDELFDGISESLPGLILQRVAAT